MTPDFPYIVEQTTRVGWLQVAAFAFRHDADFFVEEYGRVQPNVRFRVSKRAA